MNFREATDAFLAHPRSIGTIARSMERSEASIRAARDGIRKDPPGWEEAIATLAWAESERMRALAQALSPFMLYESDGVLRRRTASGSDTPVGRPRDYSVEAYDADASQRARRTSAQGAREDDRETDGVSHAVQDAKTPRRTPRKGESVPVETGDGLVEVTRGRNPTGTTGEGVECTSSTPSRSCSPSALSAATSSPSSAADERGGDSVAETGTDTSGAERGQAGGVASVGETVRRPITKAEQARKPKRGKA